jgi:hypothetical protein
MIARGIGAGRCQISPVRMPEAISGPLLRILLYEHYHGDTRITETYGKTGKLENPFATELRSYGVTELRSTHGENLFLCLFSANGRTCRVVQNKTKKLFYFVGTP